MGINVPHMKETYGEYPEDMEEDENKISEEEYLANLKWMYKCLAVCVFTACVRYYVYTIENDIWNVNIFNKKSEKNIIIYIYAKLLGVRI